MLRRSIEVSLAGSSDARVEPISWANLARPLFDLGRYEEARTLAERAMRMARERGDSVVADQAACALSSSLGSAGGGGFASGAGGGAACMGGCCGCDCG